MTQINNAYVIVRANKSGMRSQQNPTSMGNALDIVNGIKTINNTPLSIMQNMRKQNFILFRFFFWSKISPVIFAED
jgi:hypothetical protein